MSSIPEEIYHDMLLKLSVKSLLTSRKTFCLWNPATKEYKDLPKSPDVHDVDGISSRYFCYDSKSDNYILIIWHDNVVQVYSLKSDLWKTMDIVPYVHYTLDNSGVLFNGDPHWISIKKQDDYQKIVVSLDISTERFKGIELPKECLEGLAHTDAILVVLEGSLCVLNFNVCIDVWVLQDDGVEEFWTRRFIINYESEYGGRMRVVSSSTSGDILVEINDELYYYGHKFGTVRKLYSRSLRCWRRVEQYFESLVSLGAGSYVPEKDRIEESIHT
ncbi:F-box/kelch-repeat protein At3g06240-like [Papaver somniferum]|uniref:F-box/kelch-repeat protein At3g06240-like n=1 Tax=Papaver somniferum TaxID=3469 RepID=UPI000E7005D8|nr:F-box/kelch-repeat protein At3g06240-like [Papaver somniferum]